MSWEFAPEFDAAQRAALSAGKSLVYVCPPAWWTTLPLFEKLGAPGGNTLTFVLAPDRASVADGVAALGPLESLAPIHPVTGIGRTANLLAGGKITTCITTAPDFLQLMTRSGIDLEKVGRIVLAWPNTQFALGWSDALDTTLSQLSTVQRIVLTENERDIGDFLERHARRAPVVPAAPAPDTPAASLRYAVTDSSHLTQAVRSALDIINPRSVMIWDPDRSRAAAWQTVLCDAKISVNTDPPHKVDLAIALDLPTVEILRELAAAADQILALVRPTQVAYVMSLAVKTRAFRLQSEADLARDRAGMLRDRIRHTISSTDTTAALLTLAPLFDEYDPTVVAAALAVQAVATTSEPADGEVPEGWARIRISAGRADRIRTGDIVGALLNAVGVQKDQIGRIEQHDKFSLIEVRPEAFQRALDGLNGIAIRGTNITAQIDRR